MSAEPANAAFSTGPAPSPSPALAHAWPVLSPEARRALGVLIEKAKTTPDSYPLTLNSLLNGCNQKSARDPVTDYSDVELEEALAELKKLGYAQQLMGGGRTDKFRHNCYEAWRVDKVQLAILGELLLRGGQSVGDLRGRASRMEPIADLDALREQLRSLQSRGLILYLTPEDRRGAAVVHGFCSADEVAQLKAKFAGLGGNNAETVHPARTAAASRSGLEERLAALEAAVADLRREVAELRRPAS